MYHLETTTCAVRNGAFASRYIALATYTGDTSDPDREGHLDNHMDAPSHFPITAIAAIKTTTNHRQNCSEKSVLHTHIKGSKENARRRSHHRYLDFQMTVISYCCKDGAWHIGTGLQNGKCAACKHALCTDCIVVSDGKRFTYGDWVREVAKVQAEREAEQAADEAIEPDSDEGEQTKK
jgi:hypothetical protein